MLFCLLCMLLLVLIFVFFIILSFLFFVFFFFFFFFFFFSSRRRHTRCLSDWSSDVCSSDLVRLDVAVTERRSFRAARASRRINDRRAIGVRARDPRGRRRPRSEERRVGKECRSRWSP